MKSSFSFIKDGGWLTMTLAVIAGVLLVVGGVQAATTISTNIVTGGNLTVQGNASTTMLSATGISYFGGTATSTFSAAGVLTTLGNTSLVTASSSGAVTVGTDLWVGGNATTTADGAIATELTLTVGGLSSLDQASTTIFSATGISYFGGTATSTFSAAGDLVLIDTLSVANGTSTLATTTINRFLSVGSTTPEHGVTDVLIDGTATTTLQLATSGSAAGTCIQMEDATGVTVRIYVDAVPALIVEDGTCK